MKQVVGHSDLKTPVPGGASDRSLVTTGIVLKPAQRRNEEGGGAPCCPCRESKSFHYTTSRSIPRLNRRALVATFRWL